MAEATIHAFENMIRRFAAKAIAEHYGEECWQKVPERIRNTVRIRLSRPTHSCPQSDKLIREKVNVSSALRGV
jgi:hypothetical protein